MAYDYAYLYLVCWKQISKHAINSYMTWEVNVSKLRNSLKEKRVRSLYDLVFMTKTLALEPLIFLLMSIYERTYTVIIDYQKVFHI